MQIESVRGHRQGTDAKYNTRLRCGNYLFVRGACRSKFLADIYVRRAAVLHRRVQRPQRRLGCAIKKKF